MARSVFAAAAVVALASASAPVDAQTSTDVMRQSVYETSCQAVAAGGSPWAALSCAAPGTQFPAKFLSAMNSLQSQCSNGASDSWMGYISCLVEQGTKIADGDRNEDTSAVYGPQGKCSDYTFNTDLDGNLIVPAIRLPPGTALVRKNANNNETVLKFWYGCLSNTNCPTGILANDARSAVLYVAHKANEFTDDSQRWMGVYKIVPLTSNPTTDWNFYMSSVSHYDVTGTKRSSRQYSASNNKTGFFTTQWATNGDCPNATTTGGTFDYYYASSGLGSFEQCIMYAPNYGISPNGYAYPTKAVVPASEWRQWPRGYDAATLACPVSTEVVRKLAKALLDKVAATNSLPQVPVTTANVRNGGTQPDLGDVGAIPDRTTSPAAAPSPQPSPTASASGSGSSGGGGQQFDTTVSNAPLESTAPTWWPDLTSFDSYVHPSWFHGPDEPTCPTYTLLIPNRLVTNGPGDALSTSYEINAHCPLIQDNQERITTLMVVCWTLAGAFIILRA